jgi:hypothetical protein
MSLLVYVSLWGNFRIYFRGAVGRQRMRALVSFMSETKQYRIIIDYIFSLVVWVKKRVIGNSKVSGHFNFTILSALIHHSSLFN